jgi:hypothetical protein
MRMKVSVSEAIKKAEASTKRLREEEVLGRVFGFADRHEKMTEDLKRFKAALEKNKNDPNYMCKDMSGYIDSLQNGLFHAKFIVTDEKIKKRLDKVYNELVILVYLLDNIDIVP